MKQYRVGIIGCGPRAEYHAEALRQLPGVEIAGAADLAADRLKAFCDRWEIENRYLSAGQLLETQKLDLVSIVTLPPAHRALVEQCAAAGVPAINMEKVAAYDVASMDAMLAACRRSGALFTVNHQMRFMPQFQALRKLVRAGRLGELRFIRAGSRGNLVEQGTHTVDQMLFVNDDQPAEWVLG
ncbi:MAG TPA: Gfo/Idh/MocA family oxidoreductase, partial [Armatimonadota bacterium]|nr:Gfo/Idh/MocA family oxidoreductase [Armatimonadota bacterium]